ncbi:MAG TPA: YceI family protein [Gemmatimonas sp.]|nr:YceI family protein [Gemmatimonas sp.]
MHLRLLTVAGLAASTLVAAGATPSSAAVVSHAPGNHEMRGVPLVQPPSRTTQKVPRAKSSKTVAKTPAPKGDPTLPVTYVTAGEGNLARYRVRERLAGKELDNDAVGETPKVTGTIALDKSGAIAPGSGFTAQLSLLKSDQTRRDRYVRTRLLVTDSFPSTTFKVTSVRGLASPLPTSGETRFQLLGDLTVKGVTRPSVWDVSATVIGNQLKGSAKTQFTFKDFDLPQPRVAIVLSLADTIGLEYDFVMTKKTP